MSCKKILFINSQAPYGTARAQEALDVLLMLSTFDQQLSVLFLNDGILQLKSGQDALQISAKNFIAAYKALPLYDIKNVYVAAESLKQLGLTVKDLFIEANLLTNEQVSQLLAQQDSILNF